MSYLWYISIVSFTKCESDQPINIVTSSLADLLQVSKNQLRLRKSTPVHTLFISYSSHLVSFRNLIFFTSNYFSGADVNVNVDVTSVTLPTYFVWLTGGLVVLPADQLNWLIFRVVSTRRAVYRSSPSIWSSETSLPPHSPEVAPVASRHAMRHLPAKQRVGNSLFTIWCGRAIIVRRFMHCQKKNPSFIRLRDEIIAASASCTRYRLHRWHDIGNIQGLEAAC